MLREVAAQMGELDIGPSVVAAVFEWDDVVNACAASVGPSPCPIDRLTAQLASALVTLENLASCVGIGLHATFQCAPTTAIRPPLVTVRLVVRLDSLWMVVAVGLLNCDELLPVGSVVLPNILRVGRTKGSAVLSASCSAGFAGRFIGVTVSAITCGCSGCQLALLGTPFNGFCTG